MLKVMYLILLVNYGYARKHSRIAGGEVVQPDQFPFFAQLHLGLSETHASDCGGTLIDQRWILTAGHCFKSVPKENMYKGWFKVIMGTNKKNDWNGGKVNVITDFKIHPGYVNGFADKEQTFVGSSENNVAVAKMKRPYRLTKYIGIVHLPQPKHFIEVCKIGIVMGTGQTTSYLDSASDHVLYAEVTSVTFQELIKLEPDVSSVIDDTVFYTVAQWSKGHTLKGDSGSPFICYRWSAGHVAAVQYGISSFDIELKAEGVHMGVFEPVQSHMDFILQYVPEIEMYNEPYSWRMRKPIKPGKVLIKSDSITVQVNAFILYASACLMLTCR